MFQRFFFPVLLFMGAVLQSHLIAGEKIQFSAPTTSATLPSEHRPAAKESPNLFDKFKSGGADALQVPAPAPARPSTSQEDRGNWILQKPDAGFRQPEPYATRKDSDSERLTGNGLERYVQELQTMESQEQLALKEDRERALQRQGKEQQASDSKGKAAPNNLQFESQSNLNVKDLERENFSYANYWQQTTGKNADYFEEQSLARRQQFQQIFETRGPAQVALPNAASVDEKKLLADRIAPPPTDFINRTSQSSVTDTYGGGYSPLNGSRATGSEAMNARALGFDSSTLQTSRPQQQRVQAQPTILPFPKKPGSY